MRVTFFYFVQKVKEKMITVVTGAPFSGKTSYINEHRTEGDAVFHCSFLENVFGLDGKEQETKTANRILLSLLANVYTTEKNNKRLWVEFDSVPGWARAVIERYPHKIIKRKSSRALSLERAKTQEDRERIDKYFNSAETIHKFYLTNEWQRLRRFVLKEQGYLCQHCKRYGRKTEATEVHHITPVRDDYNKRLDVNNLISLCSDCHKAMHLLNGELSSEGEKLRRRVTLKIKFNKCKQ